MPDAGELGGPSTGASGTLTLSGHSGTIAQWEESPDALRWFKLANTAPTQAYAGLSATTHFRVRVADGACPEVVSNVVVVSP